MHFPQYVFCLIPNMMQPFPDYIAGSPRDVQLARVEHALAQEQVQQQLQALGVSQDEAMARVAALSPGELQVLNQRMDELPAGGILGLIGAVFIVLPILEVVGVTNVFTSF